MIRACLRLGGRVISPKGSTFGTTQVETAKALRILACRLVLCSAFIHESAETTSSVTLLKVLRGSSVRVAAASPCRRNKLPRRRRRAIKPPSADRGLQLKPRSAHEDCGSGPHTQATESSSRRSSGRPGGPIQAYVISTSVGLPPSSRATARQPGPACIISTTASAILGQGTAAQTPIYRHQPTSHVGHNQNAQIVLPTAREGRQAGAQQMASRTEQCHPTSTPSLTLVAIYGRHQASTAPHHLHCRGKRL